LSAQQSSSIFDLQIIPGITVLQLIWFAAAALVALILERIVTKYLRRFAKRQHLERHVSNSLVLTFRIVILLGVVAFVIRVGGVSPEGLLAFSALGGAAVGFASTQTIGNFVAGLYLLATRPFRVGDYVRVGTVEGIVQEITINYTKILTIGNNLVSIANIQVLQRDMANCLYQDELPKNVYCCTFEIGFDHSVSSERIAEIFTQILTQYASKLPRKPTYMLLRSGAFERVYTVYVYVENPEDFFELRQKIAEEVFVKWDAFRLKPQHTN